MNSNVVDYIITALKHRKHVPELIAHVILSDYKYI